VGSPSGPSLPPEADRRRGDGWHSKYWYYLYLKETIMTKYWIETESIIKFSYCVESDQEPDYAEIQERLKDGTLVEITQDASGEEILNIEKLSDADYIKRWDVVTGGTGIVIDNDVIADMANADVTNLNEEVLLDDKQIP